MILDCYFKYKKDSKFKSKYRMIKSTETFSILSHPDKNGDAIIYCYENRGPTQVNKYRRADYCLSTRIQYLSGIFTPEFDNSNLGFGDINNTQDALLINRVNGEIELFIAKGKKNIAYQIYLQALNNELEEELDFLRKEAKSFKG